MMPWHHGAVTESRVRVHVEAPGQIDAVVVEIDRSAGVVLGRAPDPAQVAGQLGGAPVTGHAVAVPSVSSNHAAVWLTDDGLCVRDLGSRNGTWVRVPPRETARLPRGDAQLRLATGAGAGSPARPTTARASPARSATGSSVTT
jgi:hypothetical protein